MLRGREKVSKNLLTKKMRAWQVTYKKNLKQVKAIVSASGMPGFNFQDMLKQSLFQMKDMLAKVPRERVQELAQQPTIEQEGEEA